MSKNGPKNKKPDEDNENGEMKVPPKTLLIWIAILGLIPLIMFLQRQAETGNQKTINYAELQFLVDNDLVEKGVINYDPQSRLQEITGLYKDHKVSDNNQIDLLLNDEQVQALQAFHIKTVLMEPLEIQMLESAKFRATQPNTMLTGFLFSILPFLLIAGLIYFFLIRQIRNAGKGALSFGKSKARMLSKEKNRTTFKDVAGVDEAKEEVSELVEFLKDPKKFQKLGGRIPKGILMIGSPGTGKTLLAKAIAGEADASFFSISGSDFVEMFVGVGASRVRDMFEQARKSTPCLIFIDEIDAVGRSRGHGLGGGNDEREQTLNALLVEMDGFDTQEGIIIIAATNRPDVLDPALLRPGRFDRQITVNLPDIVGREQILKVHAKNVKLGPAVDLGVIARGTPGYSGAELANLLNEAALLAARNNQKSIGMGELEEARDKVRWGRERRSLAMTDEDKKITAWHEAGHALVNVMLDHTHPLHKVTIIPRGQSLGSTMSLPKQDILNRQKKEMEDMIAVTMAGRIAEEIVTHDMSTGAAGDIQQATQLAKAMVCQYGMSERLGMVQYGGDDSDYVFLGKDMARSKAYSEHTSQEIDKEVKRLTDDGFKTAKSLIDENRPKLELIATSLLEYETLDGSQVEGIVRTGKFDPPQTPVEPPTPPMGAQAVTQTPEPEPPKPGLDPDFGGAAPATA
jgi:cell division protease FtsH